MPERFHIPSLKCGHAALLYQPPQILRWVREDDTYIPHLESQRQLPLLPHPSPSRLQQVLV